MNCAKIVFAFLILNSREINLKINWSVKTPWHEYMAVARSGLFAPKCVNPILFFPLSKQLFSVVTELFHPYTYWQCGFIYS